MDEEFWPRDDNPEDDYWQGFAEGDHGGRRKGLGLKNTIVKNLIVLSKTG